MDQGTAPEFGMWSLRSRTPGHAASRRCLELQALAPRRRLMGRVLGSDPLHPSAAPLYRATLGELRVGGILGGLGSGWHVIHSVPIAEHDHIDHLVVGPAGVFAISVTHLAGKRVEVIDGAVLVNGGRTRHLESVVDDARAVSRALTRAAGTPIVAGPLLVVAASASFRGDGSRDVVAASDLLAELRRRPAVLSPSHVAAVARVAEEWTTWRPLTADPERPGNASAFEALRRQVEAARGRRALWRGAGLATIVLAAIGAASGHLF